MKSVQEVEQIILDLVKPIVDKEFVPLTQAVDRILADDISSPLDFPYWDNSAMDGYAVRHEDIKTASATNPITLNVVEEIPAGYCPQKTLHPGQTARIFTGGMLPKGADTIVIQEDTIKKNEQVVILSPSHPQKFVRFRGSFYQAGQTLLPAGTPINPPEMAILATAQCVNVPVIRSPRIAILSTGDELITPEMTLQPGQIIDSNQYLLQSFLQQRGVIPLSQGIIPDNFTTLKQNIISALEQADWVISTGGVSVGEYDYVDRVLQELGAEIKITGVAMKPGKPLTVAVFPHHQLYFGIPGNPVSTMVTCWRLLQKAISKLSGLTNYDTSSMVQGITRNNLNSQGKRETYLWGNVCLREGSYQFSLARGLTNSANLINLQGVNALAVIPVGVNSIYAGESVKIMLL